MPPSRFSSTAAAVSAKEALRFAVALARSCSRVLEETVAGVILHGSLTPDDYIPGHSDIDLLVLWTTPLATRSWPR